MRDDVNPTLDERGRRRADPLKDAPELRDGRFIVLGEPRALVQRLTDHVVVGRFARGHLGIVGHYRQAHVEAGPFATLGEARAAWLRIRPELAAFRQSRIDSRRTGTAWPPPGSVGSGWAAQADHTAACSACARRVAGRRHLARSFGEGDPPALRARGIVRRRVVDGDAADAAADGAPVDVRVLGAGAVEEREDAPNRESPAAG